MLKGIEAMIHHQGRGKGIVSAEAALEAFNLVEEKGTIRI